jgi:hypothetical protein
MRCFDGVDCFLDEAERKMLSLLLDQEQIAKFR